MPGRRIVALATLLFVAPLAAAQSAPADDPSPCQDLCCVACPEPEAAGGRFWGGADYLLWWVKDGPLPVPLLTTGNPTDDVPGAIGQEGTRTLSGGHGLDYGTFSGVRAVLGGWLDEGRSFGLEAGGFVLEQRRTGFSAASDSLGNPPLYVPLFNVGTGQPGSFTLADPLFGAAGGAAVSSSTRLWGVEGNGCWNVVRTGSLALDVLAGYRYLSLREDLSLATVSNDLVADVQSVSLDRFATRNEFNGGQLGARLAWQRGPLALELAAKLGLGSTHSVVDVAGGTTATPAGGAPTTFPNGILTAPSNRGTQGHDAFSVVPQVGVKAGWNVTPWLRGTVGYDFLYWTRVARPGEQIDPRINTSQYFGGTLSGAALPAALFNRSDFWAQGISFGLELTF